MSYHEYCQGRELAKQDPPFYSLIQAAMRKADAENEQKLRAAFPDTWAELDARYHAPGGLLPSEQGSAEMMLLAHGARK